MQRIATQELDIVLPFGNFTTVRSFFHHFTAHTSAYVPPSDDKLSPSFPRGLCRYSSLPSYTAIPIIALVHGSDQIPTLFCLITYQTTCIWR